ncbi:MAG: hypothetical protein A2X05_00900 [Bacteroidetes bacterium GWE2_41_25]|nr:MAG: hypothetical protein A2X03_10550 [Bacteroidetes bacterium GWA2_40_15]OFX94881.1 MAG: hypothetical protein A2X05_00900 [Bacteroidetes bacterium GWE2_41_25]OFX95730.1 MAG: hypothetical protein A2X06_07305 [Bacteroidetes bacterium GWC2_40_22]OFY59083.1 MAG: hypothetical protein A2X04_15765 [Bacteroidetes bacterium GWF2_41_9]HBH82657.1 hypothetical protein [Bacteroidales bacterium]
MKTIIEKDHIICGSCSIKFERMKEYMHCSNCFACTGCEIYYCPQCDNEIVITPVRPMNYTSKSDDSPKKCRKRKREN